MLRRWTITALIAVVWTTLQPMSIVRAQGPTSADVQRLSVLLDIRESIIRAIGTPDVSTNGKVLTIARINSNMNHSAHAGWDDDAKAIAGIVSERISGKPKFGGVVAIRVSYEMRSTIFRRTHILVVDSVDFRADPNGRFQFHQTLGCSTTVGGPGAPAMSMVAA